MKRLRRIAEGGRRILTIEIGRCNEVESRLRVFTYAATAPSFVVLCWRRVRILQDAVFRAIDYSLIVLVVIMTLPLYFVAEIQS